MSRQMLLMLWILVPLIAQIDSKSTDKYVDGARLKSIKCQADNTTIFFNYCFMKAISRKKVAMNIGLKFLIPYTKPCYVQFILNYRYGTIFRQVIDTHQHEWCEIMAGKASNPFIDSILGVLSNGSPNLFHKCPYEGDLDLKNVTNDGNNFDDQSKHFPEGTYRIDVFVFKNEKQTAKLSIHYENKSALKESFG